MSCRESILRLRSTSVTRFLVLSFAFILMAGCASTDHLRAQIAELEQQVARAKQEAAEAKAAADAARQAAVAAARAADSAQSAANQALQAGQASQACCDATNDGIERMFRRLEGEGSTESDELPPPPPRLPKKPVGKSGD